MRWKYQETQYVVNDKFLVDPLWIFATLDFTDWNGRLFHLSLEQPHWPTGGQWLAIAMMGKKQQNKFSNPIQGSVNACISNDYRC